MINISAEKLTRSFEKKTALSDVGFNVSAEKIAILGTNGSGKTTLLSLISGLLKPTSGTLLFNGITPFNHRESIAKSISFMFEKPALPYNFEVRYILHFLKRLGATDLGSVKEILNEITKYEGKKITGLSTGELQLLLLFTVVSSISKTVILDEPFVHIDEGRKAVALETLRRFEKNVIFTTHVPEEAEYLAETIMLLDQGKLTWAGTIHELFLSDLFEVYSLGPSFSNAMKIVANFGYTKIVKSTFDDLSDLMKNGSLIGFRKMGIRGKYVKSE